MKIFKILEYFRFALVLFLLSLTVLLISGSFEAYRSLNSVVINSTEEPWHFGFNSLVRGKAGEVLFKGSNSSYLINPGQSFPMGHDEMRDRIIGVYVASGKSQADISCPRNFSFYRVEILPDGIRCDGTNSGFSRWVANLPYATIFLESYIRAFKELMMPS
jgi:hypothetical protein